MPERRFPPPWSVEDIGAAFVVKDSTGQQLAYVYYEEEPGRGFKKHFRKLMRSPCSRKSELPRLHFDGDQPPSPQLSPSSSSVGAFSNDCPPLPAALVRRGHWRRVRREGQQRVCVWACVLCFRAEKA
jgi:hypothetical protein